MKSLLQMAILLVGLLASSQQMSGPTFRANSRLVMVPVIVSNSAGEHVNDLRREDFLLFANGKAQEIAVFEQILSSAERYQRIPRTMMEASNVVQVYTKPQRVTIILLDLINTDFPDQVYARRQLLKYLAESIKDEPCAVLALTRGGVRVLHDFTADPKLLSAALFNAGFGNATNIASQLPPDFDGLQEEVERVDQFEKGFVGLSYIEGKTNLVWTLEGLKQIALAFESLPGRKSLIWVTGNVPYGMTLGTKTSFDLLANEARLLFESTYTRMNDAHIALYPVDARGLFNPDYIPAAIGGSVKQLEAYQRLARNRHSATIANLKEAAERTGGKAFYNNNDLVRAFRNAAEDSSQYYMLGFYADKRLSTPGWYPLRVRTRAKFQVRTRSGFTIPRDEGLGDQPRLSRHIFSLPHWSNYEIGE